MCTWLFSAMPFSVETLLRDASEVKRGTSKQFLYEKHSVNARITLGERVVQFMISIYGKDRTDGVLDGVANRANGFQPSQGDGDAALSIPIPDIPYGSWGRFMKEEMQIQVTRRKQVQLSRSLTFYVMRIEVGASTTSAICGMRHRGSCRGNGGASNARKAAGLDFALLQYFVDFVQRMSCRADSTMLI